VASLSIEQQEFIQGFHRATGMDPGVIATWIVSEVGRNIRYPPGHNDFNYLNIGNTDSQWFSGSFWARKSAYESGVISGAWAAGRLSVPGYGRADPRIVDIIKSAGRSASDQIAALINSPWASNHYSSLGGHAGLMGIYNAEFAGLKPILSRASQFSQVGFNPFDLLNRGGLGGIDTDPTPNDPGTALGQAGGAAEDALGAAGDLAGDIGSGVSSIASAIQDLFGMLTDIRFWIRLGQAIAGLILLSMGLRELGKTGGAGGAIARTADTVSSAPAKAAGYSPAGRAARAGKLRRVAQSTRR
jgi:hypothetical protein